jgi:hypothetical protein
MKGEMPPFLARSDRAPDVPEGHAVVGCPRFAFANVSAPDGTGVVDQSPSPALPRPTPSP